MSDSPSHGQKTARAAEDASPDDQPDDDASTSMTETAQTLQARIDQRTTIVEDPDVPLQRKWDAHVRSSELEMELAEIEGGEGA